MLNFTSADIANVEESDSLLNTSDNEVQPQTAPGCQPGDFFNILGLLLQCILAALAFSLLMG